MSKPNKYKVFDAKGKLLGTIFGRYEAEALGEARIFGIKDAYRVEKIEPKPSKVIQMSTRRKRRGKVSLH